MTATTPPTTVLLRLDNGLALRLEAAAKAAGVSKSEYIRECLADQLSGETKPPPTAWELGKDLFGCYDSGDGTLSERVEEVVRERIHAKFAEQRRRGDEMDRTGEYRQALINIVLKYGRLNPSPGHLRTFPLCDETRDHYAIIYAGWHDEGSPLAGPHVQHVTFFARIEDGKIYLEHDGLGEGVTDELIHKGVDPDDIVHVWMNRPSRRSVVTPTS